MKSHLYHHHHHHHVVLVAWISLTLSRHFSFSFIASDRSSGQHPVSSHSCWMYVRAGRPAFARPCVGVHKSTSLMSSSLLLQHIYETLITYVYRHIRNTCTSSVIKDPSLLDIMTPCYLYLDFQQSIATPRSVTSSPTVYIWIDAVFGFSKIYKSLKREDFSAWILLKSVRRCKWWKSRKKTLQMFRRIQFPHIKYTKNDLVIYLFDLVITAGGYSAWVGFCSIFSTLSYG